MIEKPVIKPNDNGIKPNGNAMTGINTGVEDYASLNILLLLISGVILVLYEKSYG